MKKVISWLRRLNDRLIRWQRKHPVLDAVLCSLTSVIFFLIFCIFGTTLSPDCAVWVEPFVAEAQGTSELTPFMFWTSHFFVVGFLFHMVLDCWLSLFLREKEAAPDA